MNKVDIKMFAQYFGVAEVKGLKLWPPTHQTVKWGRSNFDQFRCTDTAFSLRRQHSNPIT